MNKVLATEAFPLSPMQQGMLFHYLKEPNSGVDIEQLVVGLPETIDVLRLKRAWNWLFERHDILRARFVWEATEQPFQEISANVELSFVTQDLRSQNANQQRQVLEDFLKSDRVRGFDMHAAPMSRVTLFQLADNNFTLVWTFHHALLDGRSYPVLLREVFEAYEEIAAGKPAPRREPFAYRRYIDWLQTADFSSSLQYWRDLLKGFTATTPLVVDRKLPLEESSYQQGEAWITLDQATTTTIHELAQSYSVTTNALVMTAWSILLHRYSGEQDVVFGATRACRKSSIPDADETVGLFINTVPVRAKLSPEESAISLVKAVRQQWIELRAHEHSPLALVKSVSQISPGQQLFETLLVFENYRLDAAMHALGGKWASRTIALHELTNFPITLAAYDGKQLSFKIEFDRRRFDERTVDRMLGHLANLLKGIADNPETKIKDLPLIGSEERLEILEAFNSPAVNPKSECLPLDGGTTLHKIFESQVANSPSSIALTCDGVSISYGHANALANRLARRLVAHGVKPDTLVGICLERSNQLVIALLSILKAGGAYLPIDLAYPADRLAFMLEDAQAPVLLTQRSLADKIPATKAAVLYVDDILAEESKPSDEANLEVAVNADNLAYVIYTSGTTGKPKGSLITHRNVVRLFSATEHWYGFNATDVWTLFHSSAFDFSVWEIWGALFYGGRLVIVPFLVSRSPESFYELLAREKVTVLNQTPSAFRTLVQAEESVGQKELALRYVIFGGEALEMQSLKPWFDRHGDQTPLLVNMYGITETTVHVSYRPISKNDLDFGSVIGIPIPDLQIYILDANRQPVPVGIPGEMYVGGAGLARGYLGRPELTAQRFIPDHLTGKQGARLYKTGDLARFLPGKDIEYLGRIDDQVKIRGFRIELGEIESVLVQHPAVREVSVIAREDVPGSKRLVAYLTVNQSAPEVNELREHLKKKVPEYMVPAAFVFLDRLPLTNNAKIDRKALPVPEMQRPEVSRKYIAPRNAAEQKLASVWGKVLRIEKVGIHDNFFELGGDSILSIQVISLARREGLKLTPKLLFANQTIAELAATAGSVSDLPSEQENLTGTVPLTPIQQWFFEQHLDEANHYNQAFLLNVTQPLDLDMLQRALNEVNSHHDALRLRFVRNENGWSQSYAQAGSHVPLATCELSTHSPEELARAIESAAQSAQSSLNFSEGPLWRAVYFSAGGTGQDKLLVVVHHLAVDGISWRPLLEDLETAYLQLHQSQSVSLPAKTSSFKKWSEKLKTFASSQKLQEELSNWTKISASVKNSVALKPFLESVRHSSNTESAAIQRVFSLTAEETHLLLQKVPAAYNSQINDVLLTALAEAWRRRTGESTLFTNLEGHGRENLFDDVDLSRTVGWFTSICPVSVELPASSSSWQPGESLKSVKEQLRRIPEHGIGYGILRYLDTNSGLSTLPEPPLVFNYLGQFDQVLGQSKLFRFATETSGAWHGPRQHRRNALEINATVLDGRMNFAWSSEPALDSSQQIQVFAQEFLSVLRELIQHCLEQRPGGRTPADFPLIALNQEQLDNLLNRTGAVEDIYPLSPVQTLYFSANPSRLHKGFDQWQCSFHGELAIDLFQSAWQQTILRHTILRSSIQSQGLKEPLQAVHTDIQPQWKIEDWTNSNPAEAEARWLEFLKRDAENPIDLSQAPIFRFALVKVAPDHWKFLWSVPALLLDGWSWPLVFRDASQIYHSLVSGSSPALQQAAPYSEYLRWLKKQSKEETDRFWHKELSGFREPTGLPGESPETVSDKRFVSHRIELAVGTPALLHGVARTLQVTLNSIVQSAWAILLNRQNSASEVVFGSAFSGRPTELAGADSIVGPFVNTLPVRVANGGAKTTGEFIRGVHAHLLDLSAYQFSPLLEVQKCSEVPEWRRLFESLVVFQNYAVDDAAQRFGGSLRITDFDGPIHTNYPILLLAEPHGGLKLTFIFDTQVVAHATVKRWAQDLSVLLENLSAQLENGLPELEVLLSKPVSAGSRPKRRISVESRPFAPAQTELERSIAAIWQKMFDLDQISVEENFFDLGGYSLLLVEMHKRLQQALDREFPIVTLFERPTIRSLAAYLGENGSSAQNSATEKLQDRARQQKQALSNMRVRLKK